MATLKRLLIALATASLAACGSGQKPDVWTGWAYPEAPNLLVSKRVGDFSSLEECRSLTTNYLEAALRKQGKRTGGDYECGLNCKPDGSGLFICEETRR